MQVDEQYYTAVNTGSIAERAAIKARKAMFQTFIDVVRPTATSDILDVGVSDVVNDAANMLENEYHFPERITAIGLGEGKAFSTTYPAVKYQQIIAGRSFPYADKSFDIATSNAVVEHLGSEAAQLFFISELVRVAKKVFITIPNRQFPVEHHTNLPFVHWIVPLFRVACRMTGNSEWADRANLILLNKRNLERLCAAYQVQTGYTGLYAGPFSSNIYAYIG